MMKDAAIFSAYWNYREGTADKILDSKRDRRVSVCIQERNA